MRFFTLLVLFIKLGLVDASAQSNIPFNEKGTTLIGYHAGVGMGNSHELRVERFVHPRWSLIYSGSYSYQNFSANFSEYRLPLGCSVGVGALALSACYGASSASGVFELALVSIMIPDGVAYHAYMGKNFVVSPYLNLSGLMLHVNDEIGTRLYYSPSTGVRVMSYIGEHFVITGEQSFRRAYAGNIENTLSVGLSLKF